jgi:hypothetical protein
MKAAADPRAVAAPDAPEWWQVLAADCDAVAKTVQGLADEVAWSPAAPLPISLPGWLERVGAALGASSDVVIRPFLAGRRQPHAAAIVYIDGMVEARTLDQDVIAPLQRASGGSVPLVDAFLPAGSVKQAQDLVAVVGAVLGGQVALFIDGGPFTHLVDVRGFKARSPDEPTTERTILGSKEAFVEPLRTNTTMIRRRVRTRHLRIQEVQIGQLSPSTVAVIYVGNIANPALVAAILARLRTIRADVVQTSAELAAYMKGPKTSPFPQVERTERPEAVCREIVSGRVGVILDNDPFAILLPTTFWDLMQAPGDYAQSAWSAAFIRMVRFTALFVVASGPGLYAALVMVHLDLIPHDLALTIVGGRRGVPVPAPLEYVFLILIFEILREVSIRIPKSLGPTIGVVGGIVLGQAVVQSGIASPPLIVVVSVVGLSLFTAPHYEMVGANRYLAITSLVIGSQFGIYGLMVMAIVVVLHLGSLESYGTPYLAPAAPPSRGLWQDTVARAPFRWMGLRPEQYRPLRDRKLDTTP